VIEVYGVDNCSWCNKSKQLLESLGFEYVYKDLMIEENVTRFKKVFKNDNTIPQILWGFEKLRGYNQLSDRINKAIEEEKNNDAN